MTAFVRVALPVVLLSGVAADAAVLCAKRRADGTFASNVKIREACRPSETLLTPEAVGFCCASTTTTSTFQPCPTTTTLGLANCGGVPPSCGGQCFGGLTCMDNGSGQCACTGPPRCGVQSFCGGDCPPSFSCEEIPVPAGCPSIGCRCE